MDQQPPVPQDGADAPRDVAQAGAEIPATTAEDERRYPSTIGGACYLAIMLATLVGLVLASFGTWRAGLQIVAGALLVAALLRLGLRQRDAGMLAVRHRVVDAVLLSGAAAALFFLTATIPDQPG